MGDELTNLGLEHKEVITPEKHDQLIFVYNIKE